MQAVFLDIEATGLDPLRHRPIDLAFQVVNVTTGTKEERYQTLIKQPKEAWECADPVSLKVNGYTWEQVSQGKDPILVGEEIVAILTRLEIKREKAVFICQNPAFDRSYFMQLVDVYTQEKLNWPYHWLDFASMYWALLSANHLKNGTPFPEQLNLSKNEIAKRFCLPEEEKPHSAVKGVEHLMLCYQTVLGVKFR